MKRLYFLLMAILFCWFCGPKQKSVEKYMEDGIEVVDNHLEPYSLKGMKTLSLEKTLTIDTESEETIKFGVADIDFFDIDSSGNIFVSHREPYEKCIYKFDKEGRFISAFGNVGQGPGELQAPSLLVVSGQDEVVMTDREKVLVFSNSGEFIKELRKQNQDFQDVIPLDQNKYLAVKMDLNQDLSQTMSIVLCSSELKEIKVLDSSKIESFSSLSGVSIIPTIAYWANSSRSIFTGNTDEYEIRVFDFDGKQIRKIRKENKAVLLSDSDKDSYEQYLQRYPPKMRERFFIPDSYPPFQRLIPCNENWLFVQTYKEPRDGFFVYDIFSSEGVYSGTIELEGFWATIKGEYLYCLRDKESGYRELNVYKMMWN